MQRLPLAHIRAFALPCMAAVQSQSRSRSRSRASSSDRFVGLDFDCTITVRHYYKCLATGLVMGRPSGHPHCPAFMAWLRREKTAVTPQDLEARVPNEHPILCAVECLQEKLGEEKFKQLIREVFLGGDERIQQLTAWLTAKKKEGVDFAIITAGLASTVSIALEAVPEWDDFFPTDVVLDVGASRHQVLSVTGQKALMLRDLRPLARIILVDDSLGEDPIPAWIRRRAQVFSVALPYEGSGLSQDSCARVDEALKSS
ncbi:unnamed protein product [Effrenium voratum]|nr:unnamed protein product [Effrenium voratum]